MSDLPAAKSPYRKDIREERVLAHSEEARMKIKITECITFLENVALGKIKKYDANRVRAAEILLKKVMPDLTAQKNEGGGTPITFNLSFATPEKQVITIPVDLVSRTPVPPALPEKNSTSSPALAGSAS